MVRLIPLFTVSSYFISKKCYGQSEDYYCGISYGQSKTKCELACPSGLDVECSNVLGVRYQCYYFTGCAAREIHTISIAGTDSPTIKPSSSFMPTSTLYVASTSLPSSFPSALVTFVPSTASPKTNPTYEPSEIPSNEQSSAYSAPSMEPTPNNTAMPSYIKTLSPSIYITKMNMILMVRNTPNRKLTSNECNKLKYILLNFFFIHISDEMNVKSIDVLHQDQVVWREHANEERELSVTSSAISLELQVSHKGYSDFDISQSLMLLIEVNEMDILDSFQRSAYPFFSHVDAISSSIVEEVVSFSTDDGGNSEDGAEISKPKSLISGGRGVAAGIAAAVMVASFSGIGLAYYFAKRNVVAVSETTKNVDLEAGWLQSSIDQSFTKNNSHVHTVVVDDSHSWQPSSSDSSSESSSGTSGSNQIDNDDSFSWSSSSSDSTDSGLRAKIRDRRMRRLSQSALMGGRNNKAAGEHRLEHLPVIEIVVSEKTQDTITSGTNILNISSSHKRKMMNQAVKPETDKEESSIHVSFVADKEINLHSSTSNDKPRRPRKKESTSFKNSLSDCEIDRSNRSQTYKSKRGGLDGSSSEIDASNPRRQHCDVRHKGSLSRSRNKNHPDEVRRSNKYSLAGSGKSCEVQIISDVSDGDLDIKGKCREERKIRHRSLSRSGNETPMKTRP